jgi:hypothetical protein
VSRRRGLVAGVVVLAFVLAGCSDVAASESIPSPSNVEDAIREYADRDTDRPPSRRR